MKKTKFYQGAIYHIFNKSIADYRIFKDTNNSQRFVEVLDYYNNIILTQSFSKSKKEKKYNFNNLIIPKNNSLIKFISYCIMPDHYHLLLKILREGVISKYINDVENSYTRFFNLKYKRKGPLWQTDFKAVRIRSNEQLLHVSRYIHLNPTTSFLIKNPEDWQFSSYKNFISNKKILEDCINEISIRNKTDYKYFVENQIEYQRKLKLIKKLIFD